MANCLTFIMAPNLPVYSIESIIKEKQQAYYESYCPIQSQWNSNAFVIFMLDAINQSVRQLVCDSFYLIFHMLVIK